MNVAKDTVVEIHYTLTNDAGEVIDSSEGQDALAYLHGHGNLIPGLENELSEKSVGSKLKVSIAPEEAYGLRSEDMIQTVTLSNFEDPDAVKVGVQFQVQGPAGVQIATVTALEGENVTVDMNHPLAGETLHFDVEIVSVRAATEEELSHGHVHGAGGHHH